MKLQMTLRTWRFFSSTARPWPWLPQLLLMMVSPLTPRRAIASMQASALPDRPKPPDMIDIPSREPVERRVDVGVDLGLHPCASSSAAPSATSASSISSRAMTSGGAK